jgi:hypothetical protein
MLCSAYLDCKLDAWPTLLDDLALYCVQNKLKLVIGADMNTHSSMWNKTRSHSNRTAKVEQGIIQNNMFLFNTGTVPTFRSHIGESIIDVTMSNDPECVTNWKVSEEVSHSKHIEINFSITDIKQTEATLRRNVRKVNWAAVSSDLRGAVPRDTPATWTSASLDAACESITCALQKSLDKHAPKKPPTPKFNYWWNDECTEKKSLLKTTEFLERRHPTLTTKLDFKNKRDNDKNAIYTAKRTSWKKFIKEVDSTPAMARVNKIMRASGAPAAELGLVKDNLGILVKDKTETLQQMLDEHFPDSTPAEEIHDQTESNVPNFVPATEWLTKERFRRAVNA